MREAWAIIYLVRPDTCFIAFLAIFVPLYCAHGSISYSLVRAIPIALILMAGFVINDVHDTEKDRENHPTRALPSALMSPAFAISLYFSLVTVSLAIVRFYLDAPATFLYLILLLGLINYNYVVAYAPTLKNIFAALVFTIPIVILTKYLHGIQAQLPVIAALFATLLGREMLMDVLDSKGDGKTFAKIIGSKRAVWLAFVLNLFSTCLLFLETKSVLGKSLAALLLFSDLALALTWTLSKYRRLVIHLLKVHFVLGIYYLM